MRTMLKGLLTLAITLLTIMAALPVAADDGYIACMDRAITHKYALIDAGWSYSEAHADYLYHTQRCYIVFYGQNLNE